MTEIDSKTSETSTEEVAPEESQPTAASEAVTGSETKTEAAAETAAGTAPAAASESESASAAVSTAAPVADTAAAGESVRQVETASASETESAAEGGTGKKKRRRRRKRKGGAQAGSTDAPPSARASHHHAPFLHLFSGGGPRKHAFSVGEVIAGRVERVEHGVIIVDLFGKAIAITDADEPRDIPFAVHEPEPAHAEPAPKEPTHGQAAVEPGAPIHTPVVPAPVSVPTPVVEATPAVAMLAQDDPASWEHSPTEVSDIPDDDLGEADTVVGVPAYDPTVPPEPAPTPETTSKPDAASETLSGSAAASPSEHETHEGHEHDPEHDEEHDSSSDEDLADADLSLLEPLPELEAPQPGAIFRGRIGAVAESGHIAIVNRLVDKAAVRKALRAARERHLRVQGVVYGYNRGGFDVLVGGVRAFCPASAMSLTPIEDPSAFIAQRCEFSLPRDKGGKKSIIVSRRNILEKEARKRARERMEELQVGAKLGGKVLDVRDYGVLVDLGGGLDGLVHMSEVSWSRGVKPHEVVQVGDEVDVQVLKVQPATRKDRYGRVSLSMRACQPDPWDVAKDTIRPGMPIKGKVVRTTDFGAFIELQENIEGLLHISELGGNRELMHAKQAVSEGDEIDVVVERVDRGQRRISLSKLSEADAKAIEAGEIEVGKAPRSLKPGSHISVIVKRVEHGGAQVQVDGVLGKRGRGFIPNRELQDIRGENRKGPSQGEVLDVKIIGTERDGTLRCSVRARLLDEERNAVREYRKESAKQGLGTFGDLLKAKLGESSE